MDSNTDWIKFGAGMVFLTKGDIQKAEEIFNDIQAYGRAAAQLGFMRHNEGNLEEAKLLYHKALEKLPEDEMGLYYRGYVQTKLNNYDAAAESFSRVIELNPVNFDAIIFLAGAMGLKGNREAAVKIIDEIYQENKNFRNGFARLGWMIKKNQDWSVAIEIMSRDYNKGRMDPGWLVNMAQMFGRIGNWEKAIEMIINAYASANYLKDGFARLGWIKAENQDWSGAVDIINQDIELDRILPESRIKFAMLLVFMGDNNGAVKLIHNLYACNNKINDGYATLGWAHYLLSRNKQNLIALTAKDARLKRLSVDGKKINAFAKSVNGELSAGTALVDSLYSDNPFLKDGYALVGWALIENGDRATGMTLMEKDYVSNRLSSVWRINYAYQLAKGGQCQQAQSLFHKEMELEPYRQEFRIGDQTMPSIVMTKKQFQEFIGLDCTL